MLIHPDRLFSADPSIRKIARILYESVRALPLVSPHGHTLAAWFAADEPFRDPAQLFVQLDHYVFRMLYSQGVSLDDLGIGQPGVKDPREVWRIFASLYHLFRATPTRIWLDFAFQELFGLKKRLSRETADFYFDVISERLLNPDFRPRALYQRFNLEVLATTDSPLDSLDDHKRIRESKWKARIVPTFRPDPVVDPDFAGFSENVARLGSMTGEDTSNWCGYLNSLRLTRARFRELGCVATDHGHPTARTANLSSAQSAQLFASVISGKFNSQQSELFRAPRRHEPLSRACNRDRRLLQYSRFQRRYPSLSFYSRAA